MNYAHPPRVRAYGDWMLGDREPEAVAIDARLLGRWNGWAVPAFDRAGVDLVMEAQRKAFAYGEDELPDMTWEGDEVVVSEDWTDEETEVTRVGPMDIDGVPHWDLGLGWTWDCLDFEDPATPTPEQRAAVADIRDGLRPTQILDHWGATCEPDGTHVFRLKRQTVDPGPPRVVRLVTVRELRIGRDGTVAASPTRAR